MSANCSKCGFECNLSDYGEPYCIPCGHQALVEISNQTFGTFHPDELMSGSQFAKSCTNCLLVFTKDDYYSKLKIDDSDLCIDFCIKCTQGEIGVINAEKQICSQCKKDFEKMDQDLANPQGMCTTCHTQLREILGKDDMALEDFNAEMVGTNCKDNSNMDKEAISEDPNKEIVDEDREDNAKIVEENSVITKDTTCRQCGKMFDKADSAVKSLQGMCSNCYANMIAHFHEEEDTEKDSDTNEKERERLDLVNQELFLNSRPNADEVLSLFKISKNECGHEGPFTAMGIYSLLDDAYHKQKQ